MIGISKVGENACCMFPDYAGLELVLGILKTVCLWLHIDVVGNVGQCTI